MVEAAGVEPCTGVYLRGFGGVPGHLRDMLLHFNLSICVFSILRKSYV